VLTALLVSRAELFFEATMSQITQWIDEEQAAGTSGAVNVGLSSQQIANMPLHEQGPVDMVGDMPTMLDQGQSDFSESDLEGAWFDASADGEAEIPWAVTPSKVVTVDNMSNRWNESDQNGEDAKMLRTWRARITAIFQRFFGQGRRSRDAVST
jgi:hypothetical protein